MPSREVFSKFKAGKLKSGSGHPVTQKKQATAIYLSEKRAEDEGDGEYHDRPARKKPRRRGRA